MESHTTEIMKDVAKTIANEITEKGKEFGCSECIVDDYGKFGNFQLICYLNVERNHHRTYSPKKRHEVNLTLLVNTIKRVIKSHEATGAQKRSHECPQNVYRSNSCGGMRFKPDYLGYEKNYIYIEMDFIPYHPESNTFAVQTQAEPLRKRKGEQLAMF